MELQQPERPAHHTDRNLTGRVCPRLCSGVGFTTRSTGTLSWRSNFGGRAPVRGVRLVVCQQRVCLCVWWLRRFQLLLALARNLQRSWCEGQSLHASSARWRKEAQASANNVLATGQECAVQAAPTPSFAAPSSEQITGQAAVAVTSMETGTWEGGKGAGLAQRGGAGLGQAGRGEGRAAVHVERRHPYISEQSKTRDRNSIEAGRSRVAVRPSSSRRPGRTARPRCAQRTVSPAASFDVTSKRRLQLSAGTKLGRVASLVPGPMATTAVLDCTASSSRVDWRGRSRARRGTRDAGSGRLPGERSRRLRSRRAAGISPRTSFTSEPMLIFQSLNALLNHSMRAPARGRGSAMRLALRQGSPAGQHIGQATCVRPGASCACAL